MANRTMEQKKIKAKRMRRAWAKPLARRSGMNPNRIVINEYKDRAKGLAFDESVADQIAAKLLKASGEGPFEKKVPPGKLEALRRQGEIEAELPDGCDLRLRGPGPSDELQESWTYFNARKDCYVLFHFDFEKGIERRSIPCSSYELLLMRWDMNKVMWAYSKPIQAS